MFEAKKEILFFLVLSLTLLILHGMLFAFAPDLSKTVKTALLDALAPKPDINVFVDAIDILLCLPDCSPNITVLEEGSCITTFKSPLPAVLLILVIFALSAEVIANKFVILL